jgi:hypothetical protein
LPIIKKEKKKEKDNGLLKRKKKKEKKNEFDRISFSLKLEFELRVDCTEIRNYVNLDVQTLSCNIFLVVQGYRLSYSKGGPLVQI